MSQNLQKFRVLYRICYKSHRNFGYCTGRPTEEAFVKIRYCVKVVQIPGGIVLEVPQNLQKFRVLCWKCYRTYKSFGYCTGSPTEAFVKIRYCVKVVQIPGGIVLEVLQNLQNFRVLCWIYYRTYRTSGYCAERRTNVTKSSGTGTFEEKYPRYPL